MLDIYNPEDEGDNAQYPWPVVCMHMGQLCFILTKVFKGFDLCLTANDDSSHPLN